VLVIASLLVFVIFLDRYLHRLRPVAVTVLVAGYVQRDFKQLLRGGLITMPDMCLLSGALEGGGAGEQPALVVRSTTPGSIQAIDAHGLVEWARRHDCLVVVHHTVGDFVPVGCGVARGVWRRPSSTTALSAGSWGMVALGSPRRTIDQDPAFAIRIMVGHHRRAGSIPRGQRSDHRRPGPGPPSATCSV